MKMEGSSLTIADIDAPNKALGPRVERCLFALCITLLLALPSCDGSVDSEYKKAMGESGQGKVNQLEQQMADARGKGDKTLKPFRIPSEQMKELIPNVGGCFATDRILVDGCRVGYMYREEPDFAEDSGWRFFAGDETDEYIDDEWNTGIYSVNTVCNYDPEIISFIDAPTGSAFARDSNSGKFQRIKAPTSKP